MNRGCDGARRAAFLLPAAVGLMVALTATPALAKVGGPFHVLTPEGELRIVDGPAADIFWEDWWQLYSERASNCLSCSSPSQAAEVHQSLYDAYWRDDRSHPTGYLIRPLSLSDDGWDDAFVFYPSTDSTPAYLVDKGGTGTRRQRWDWWSEATKRMQRIVLGANPVEDSESPLRWIVVALAAAALGGAVTRSVTSR